MPHKRMIMLIDKILSESKSIAVVGLSPKPVRTSYQVSKYLQDHGYHIIPVNPESDTILGEKSYSNLGDISGPVDIVLIFRRPELVPPIVEEAIKLSPKYIWMQEGIVNEDAAQNAAHHGIPVVMDHCMLKEHSRRN